MTEDFLQFIWRFGLFQHEEMATTTGEKVEVMNRGTLNPDAGPDFFNAQIRIGETLWAGNVEVHLKASDWYRHLHNKDEAYQNVILHVVGVADVDVWNHSDNKIPCTILNFAPRYQENYQLLLQSENWIPCAPNIGNIAPERISISMNRLLIERLQDKTGEIIARLEQNKWDWSETFYQFLARNFGFKVNALPFEMIARSLPLSILGKHRNNLFQLEALLFGQAGFLTDEFLGDDYFMKLREEYLFLAKKYNLHPIEKYMWKFLRLRPVNFPTLRISQFAGLIHKSRSLFSKIMETVNLKELEPLFDIRSSEYWSHHYQFNRSSSKLPKSLGRSAFNNIIINTVVPFLFVYGNYQNISIFRARALAWLEELPAERNSIISNWKELGIQINCAFDSQAMIQLKHSFCNSLRCLDCPMGLQIIKR